MNNSENLHNNANLNIEKKIKKLIQLFNDKILMSIGVIIFLIVQVFIKKTSEPELLMQVLFVLFSTYGFIYFFVKHIYIPYLERKCLITYKKTSYTDKFLMFTSALGVIILFSIATIVIFGLVEGNYLKGTKYYYTHEIKLLSYLGVALVLAPLVAVLLWFFGLFIEGLAELLEVVFRSIIPYIVILVFITSILLWIGIALEFLIYTIPFITIFMIGAFILSKK